MLHLPAMLRVFSGAVTCVRLVRYWMQVQGQLLVTGAERARVVIGKASTETANPGDACEFMEFLVG